MHVINISHTHTHQTVYSPPIVYNFPRSWVQFKKFKTLPPSRWQINYPPNVKFTKFMACVQRTKQKVRCRYFFFFFLLVQFSSWVTWTYRKRISTPDRRPSAVWDAFHRRVNSSGSPLQPDHQQEPRVRVQRGQDATATCTATTTTWRRGEFELSKSTRRKFTCERTDAGERCRRGSGRNRRFGRQTTIVMRIPCTAWA